MAEWPGPGLCPGFGWLPAVLAVAGTGGPTGRRQSDSIINVASGYINRLGCGSRSCCPYRMGRIGGVPQTCKPGSVFFPYGKNGDHLSSPTVSLAAGGSPLVAERRYRRGQAANPGTGRAPKSPYLALLQVGFSRRCVTAVGRTLLPSDFTLIPTSRDGMFLCHFPFPTPANR